MTREAPGIREGLAAVLALMLGVGFAYQEGCDRAARLIMCEPVYHAAVCVGGARADVELRVAVGLLHDDSIDGPQVVVVGRRQGLQ